MEKGKAVQGVALYGEFSRLHATTQMVILPDGYTSEGNLVNATIMRRTVTKHSPKKQWRFDRLASTELQISDDESKAAAGYDRMQYAATLFEQLIRGEWKLVKKPILVEVSMKDYDTIRDGKTPTKLIYRISQSRNALDYPEDLIQTDGTL